MSGQGVYEHIETGIRYRCVGIAVDRTNGSSVYRFIGRPLGNGSSSLEIHSLNYFPGAMARASVMAMEDSGHHEQNPERAEEIRERVSDEGKGLDTGL